MCTSVFHLYIFVVMNLTIQLKEVIAFSSLYCHNIYLIINILDIGIYNNSTLHFVSLVC